MDQKTYTGKMLLKADAPGEFEAVFATLKVIDKDNDVTLPGAFSAQPVLIEPWNHNYQQLPVGKGAIEERGDEAIVAGKFFLDTVSGAEHHLVVKELGEMQEWSYSFNILEADYGKHDGRDVRFLKKMDVIGVGPVMRGAGENTRTTDIKNHNSAEGEAANGGKLSGVVRSRIDLEELDQED